MSFLTPNSKVLIALTAFTGVLALIFQGHLLVYTGILLLTTCVTLFIWSFQCTKGLTIEREHTQICMKGQNVLVTLKLINRSKYPRFLVFGYDYFPAERAGDTYKSVIFPSVAKHSEALYRYQAYAARRGVYNVGPFYFYSGDPLGFFRHVRKVDVYTKITVVPVPLPTRLNYLQSRSRIQKDEYSTIAVPGQSTEFLGVREYQHGDPLRKIHWMSTARTGELITKQFEKNVASSLSILLINYPELSNGKFEEHTPLEYSITIISTLANEVSRRRSYVSFKELNGNSPRSASGMGESFFETLSYTLASVTKGEPFELKSYYEEIMRSLPSSSDLIVIIPTLSSIDAEILSHLRLNFKSLSVLTFDLNSFITAVPRRAEKTRFTFARNFMAFEIAFGDDLTSKLEQFIGKAGLIK